MPPLPLPGNASVFHLESTCITYRYPTSIHHHHVLFRVAAPSFLNSFVARSSLSLSSSCLLTYLCPLLEELLRTVGVRLDGLLSRRPTSGASLPLMRVGVLQSLHGPDDLVDAAACTVVIDSHGAHHARRVDDEHTLCECDRCCTCGVGVRVRVRFRVRVKVKGKGLG